MKTIKILVPFLLLTFSIQNSLAQKIKIKDNIAYVDEVACLKVSDCGMYKEDCSISTLEGKEIISIDKLKNQNKPGTYLRVVFKGLNTTIEVNKTIKQLVEILYKYNAVDKDGKLIPESVKVIHERYGNRFSVADSDDKYDND